MSWREVPQALPRHRSVPGFLPWLLVVVPLGGVLATYGFGAGHFVAVAAILGAATLALKVWPAGLPIYLVVATFGFSAATDRILGWHLTAVAFVPLAFWMIALGCSERPYRWLPPGRLFRPCLIPLALATATMMVTHEPWIAQRLVAVTCALAVLIMVLPRLTDRVLGAIELRLGPLSRLFSTAEAKLARLGHHVGRAAGVVVMVPASVIVLITWAWQRVVRFDPLVAPTSGVGRWVQRAGGDPEPQRLFSSSSVLVTRTRDGGRRFAAAALTAATIVAIVAATVPGARNMAESVNNALIEPAHSADGPCMVPPDPAMKDDPGWPQAACDTANYSVNGRFSAVTTYTMADFESETVNVHDGVRRSWHPPECDCRRITMWMFGGSAAFGWYQRDDLTIASQLSQLAWQEGIALDIEVRANPGWVLGQEHRLFSQLSVTEDEMPDLALFYDGGNELQRQMYRNWDGRGADESPTSYAEEDIDRLLREGPFPWYAGEQLDRGEDRSVDQLPPEDVARHAMNRYLRDLELARRTTAAAGVEVVFFWQPLLVTAGREAGNPDALTDEQWRSYARMLDVARPMIPDDVIDLSDVLDGADHPVFKDFFHHNVEAGGIIAAAMLDELRPRIRAIAGG